MAGHSNSQALLTLLDDGPLLCPFSQEDGYIYTHNLYFYDRNQVGKELDFDSNPDQKEPFLRYVVSFQLQYRAETSPAYPFLPYLTFPTA